MKTLQLLAQHECEQILAFHDSASGLRGFLAIDSIHNGISFGGVRIHKYSDEESALVDCLTLAKTMSRKCHISRIPAGGAKIVLIEHGKLDRAAALKKLGRIINEFHGTVYTGRDLGSTHDDMAVLKSTTKFVIDETESEAGDLAKCTAYGVYRGMEALCKFAFGKDSIKGRTVLIQGLGAVGQHLVGYCNKAGAKLLLSDIVQKKAKTWAQRFRCQAVLASKVYETPCDIFAPCAVGGLLNREAISKLQCKIVAGSANNVFESTEENDRHLYRRKILTAPDYLLNSGALIQGANYILHKKKSNMSEIDAIYDQTIKILRLSKLKDLPPGQIALQFLDPQ